MWEFSCISGGDLENAGICYDMLRYTIMSVSVCEGMRFGRMASGLQG